MRYVSLFFIMLISALMMRPAFADDLAVTTTAFLDQNALPTLYTCDGKDISPELAWTNPPAKTKTFAVVMTDPDAPGGTFYHWIVYNIPATAKELTENLTSLPAGSMAGKNSWEKTTYNGPCPPKGSVHNYIITLYALDSKLDLPAGADGKTVLAALKDHTLKSVKLTASYSRWLK